MAIRFDYMMKSGQKLDNVRLEATFYETIEDVEKAKAPGEWAFENIILLGAKWDYEKYLKFLEIRPLQFEF